MGHGFDGQVALVTGGSTGIGAAVALLLAERGARVVITGRSQETLSASAARHPAISAVVADARDPADAARTLAEVERLHGRLDILVNNAGIAQVVPLAEAGPEHARELFETNVLGPIELTRRALPLLRASRGNVVNVASTVADQPFAGMSVYSATKGAVLGLTRAWAQELAGEGIRVNAVSPGPIATPIHAPDKLKIPAEALQSFGEQIRTLVPLGRFGAPEEVAEVVAFLASRAASYVTGAQYTVGGGIEA